MDGFKIGCTLINIPMYADNTVILFESEDQLQELIDVLVAESDNK